MKKWLALLAVIILAIPTWFAFAQDSPSPSIEITGANASDLPTITLNTTVLDSSNRPVRGLTAADFTLGGDLEGLATIINVENVTDDSLAFASVLVIDTSTSMSGAPLAEAQAAASLFVQSVGENDPIAIVSFDSDARLVQDYTTDKDLLLSEIAGLYVRGRTALYDAAVLGVEVAANAPVPRRAVILLSDGAEYGGESVNGRAAGLETATRLGVPVYTIGLGYGTDRSYLEELASGTNARSYESPAPQQLSEIYADLATLFRSQYILTLDSTIAGDGTEYAFSLQSNTPDGATNVDTGTLRAPIPVPIVRFPDGIFDEPIASSITISPLILADQSIDTVTATIDGNSVELVDGAVLIDPSLLPPNTYTLVVTATDVDGDSGSAEASFETAPLPPTVTITNLPSGTITAPVEISLSIESQTPVTSASYAVTDIEGSTESEDAENGFPFTLDPLAYPAGDYELSVTVNNEAGASATVTAPFTVGDAAPRNLSIEGLDGEISEATTLSIVADVQAGTELSSVTLSANGETLDSLTIDPLDYPAGELTLEATATDSNGQSNTESLTVTIASVAPEVDFGDLPESIMGDTSLTATIRSQSPVTASYAIDEGAASDLSIDPTTGEVSIPVSIANLENGEHSLVVTLTDENGETTSATVAITVQLPPTATPTADAAGTEQALIAGTSQAETAVARQATLDANATRVFNDEATRSAESTVAANANAAQATTDAQATSDAQAALDAQATSDAQSTLDAESGDTQATTDAQNTLDAQAALDAQATVDAQAALDAQATSDAQATEEVAVVATGTDEPTVAPSSTATLTLTPPPTVGATLTPIGEIIEVDAQNAPPVESNFNFLIAVCAGLGIVALIFVAILFFGRRRRNDG